MKFNEYFQIRENLEWAKQRALEYLKSGDTKNAVMSMVSDLKKLGMDNPMIMPLAQAAMHSPAEAQKFIMGFGDSSGRDVGD